MKIKRHSFGNKMIFLFFFIIIRTGFVVLFFYKGEGLVGKTLWVIDLILIYALWYNLGNWFKIKKLERIVKRGGIPSVQAKVISFSESSWNRSKAFYNIVFEYEWNTYQSAYDYLGKMSLPLLEQEDLNNTVLTLFRTLNIPWFPHNLQQTLQVLETFTTQEDIQNYFSNKLPSFARTTLSNLDNLQNNKMSICMHEWTKNMLEILTLAKTKIEEKVKNWENSLDMSLNLTWTNINIKVWDYLPIYFDPNSKSDNTLPANCLIDTKIWYF